VQIKNLLLIVTVALLFSLIVVGAYVAADPSAGEACGSSESWPLCNGQLFPSSNPNVIVEYTHRLLAIVSALFLFATTVIYWRSDGSPRLTRNALALASLLMVFQIGLGDVVIGADLEPALVALHQASAIAIFGLTVASVAGVKRAS
jgi:heme a synthase